MYIKSTDDGIWIHPEHNQFAYSDGDEVENRIAAILKETQDLSTLSAELRQRITDWPTQYHFSSQRSNLLRPLKPVLAGSVLEIGSGCGAITRLLGETAQSVLALEGSRRRAQITRERTRDQAHVDVYCDEFSRFTTPQTFDAVTLIGVLEYAALFVQGEEPHLRMLQRARELLNDDGCLVIAIENQLGLKYFAGAMEDHLGRPMMGLENNYVDGGVRTFGQHALKKLLTSAGLEDSAFYYPFPDYKLPSSVLSERAFEDTAFNPSPFLVSTAGKDPQLPQEPTFAMERVWPVMFENGLAQAVSNSFLIVARKRRVKETAPGDALAWHYSTSRMPAFCKETVFGRAADPSSVLITRHRLSEAQPTENTSAFEHHPGTEPSYTKAPLLSEQFVGIISRPEWTFDQLKGFLFRYASVIEQSTGVRLLDGDALVWDAELSGALFDCLPQNIAMTSENTALIFDQEWRSRSPIRFKHLVFRALLNGVGELSSIGYAAAHPDLSMFAFLERVMGHTGANITRADLTAWLRTELDFQRFASGVAPDFVETLKHLQFGKLRQTKGHDALSALKEKYGNLQWKLDTGIGVVASDEPPTGDVQRLLEAEKRASQVTLKEHSAYFSLAIDRLTSENHRLAGSAADAARLSVEQNLVQCKVGNFVKQLVQARAFSIRLKALDGATYRCPTLTLLPAAIRYVRNTPTVAVFFWVDDVFQVSLQLSRWGQLAVPMRLIGVCRSEALARETETVAARMGLAVGTALQGPDEASVDTIRNHPFAQGGNLILLAREVTMADSTNTLLSTTVPSNPQPAYQLMRTDTRIGALYLSSAASGPHAQASLALFQPAFFQASGEVEWALAPVIHREQLAAEQEHVRLSGARQGMHTLTSA